MLIAFEDFQKHFQNILSFNENEHTLCPGNHLYWNTELKYMYTYLLYLKIIYFSTIF